jgi:1-acyl-sn-glycerol-3-phosphate acyltransferase
LGVIALSWLMPPRRFDRLTKWGCRLILRVLCVRVSVQGDNRLRNDRNYLFICNHVNILDVLVLYGYISRYFRGVELDEHFDWFYYGTVIRRLEMIPISQTNGRSALKSLKVAQKAISEGTSILILPEGGRTLDGNLQPFKRGSFLLAKKAKVDLVPMAMVGAFDIKRKGNWIIRPGRLVLRFGSPIAYEQIKDMHIDTITDLVRENILKLMESKNIKGDPIETRGTAL